MPSSYNFHTFLWFFLQESAFCWYSSATRGKFCYPYNSQSSFSLLFNGSCICWSVVILCKKKVKYIVFGSSFLAFLSFHWRLCFDWWWFCITIGRISSPSWNSKNDSVWRDFYDGSIIAIIQTASYPTSSSSSWQVELRVLINDSFVRHASNTAPNPRTRVTQHRPRPARPSPRKQLGGRDRVSSLGGDKGVRGRRQTHFVIPYLRRCGG